MFMQISLRLSLVGLSLAPCIICLAQEKPAVAVRFALTEPAYRREFDDAVEIPHLEKTLSARIAKQLGKHIAYLNFTSAISSPFTLGISLDRKVETMPEEVMEVGFHITLEGTEHNPEKMYWPFRLESSADDPVGGVEPLMEEIALAFARISYPKLVAEVLNEIPIAHDALFLQTPTILAWVIPYTQEQTCMDRNSLLDIKTVFFIPGLSDISGEYVAKVQSAYLPDQPDQKWQNRLLTTVVKNTGDIELLRSTPKERVKQLVVYVREYRYSERLCSESEQPDSGLFSVEGESQ